MGLNSPGILHKSLLVNDGLLVEYNINPVAPDFSVYCYRATYADGPFLVDNDDNTTASMCSSL